MSISQVNNYESKVQTVLRPALSLSEVVTIVVYFHLSHCREFKNYYLIEIKKNLKSEFPKTVSYNRFVELMPNALTVIASFLSNFCLEFHSLILQFSKYATTEEFILIRTCHLSRLVFSVRKTEAEQNLAA
ncbi:hypothetical protein LEP1GSC021_4590 [Leptospira noguchii str. 1993005606]|nr:hypothetical protein LEP1GSC021_4590 [Leptospira noguchii str. 1993005606]